MTLSVVIVSYRTPRLTLSAVQGALEAGADEVIVVDNASGDESVGLLKGLNEVRLLILENAENLGFGTAANLGAQQAGGTDLVFLNSDAELNRTGAELLQRSLRNFDGRALIGPRLVDPDGSVQRSAGLLPAPFDLTVRALGGHRAATWVARVPLIRAVLRRMPIVSEYESARTASEAIGTSMVSGACFVVGRKAFEGLGGFDERFFMYFEDADLCRRGAAAGLAIRYLPEAFVSHVGGASSSEDYHFGPLHARSMRQYLEKWYGRGGSAIALVLLWLRAFGFTVTLRPGSRRAWAALWAAIRDEDPRR